MARQCLISGKKPLAGNNVSHAHNKTRRRQLPNMHTKHLFVPELGRAIRLKVSSAALRTISKIGLIPYLSKRGLSLKDIR